MILKLLNKIPVTSWVAWTLIHFLLASLLEETIEICTNSPFRNNDTVHGLKKSEFKDLLSLANKESYFILNNLLYKQTEGVAMRSPLRPSLVNTFLAYYEHN